MAEEDDGELYEWQKTLDRKNPDYEPDGSQAVVTDQTEEGEPVETQEVNLSGGDPIAGDKGQELLAETDGEYTITGQPGEMDEANVVTNQGEVVKEDVDVSGDKTVEVTEPDPQEDKPEQSDVDKPTGTNFRVTTKGEEEPADDQKRDRSDGRRVSLPRGPRSPGPSGSGLGLDLDPTTAILAVGGALVAVIALMRGDD